MRYLLLLFPAMALANGNPHNDAIDVTQSSDVITGDVVVNPAEVNVQGGDTNLNYSGSRAYAFAHGLGGVRIADCLASQQWGSIIVSRQKVILNKWCAAEAYDAKGLYDVAARMRCTIPEIASLFASESECRTANTMTPPPVPPVASAVPPTPAPVPTGCPPTRLDCIPMPIEEIVDEVVGVVEAVHEDHVELVVDMQAKIANLEQERAQDERNLEARREYRREMAQQMIEKLSEPPDNEP